ncbi:uncharacterized protein LOC127803011 [Diospyros lotus]|uniref:uncharacterized protein LOC127803011 n=1 Tax=Diospyros lotus TaxID=55363 RepID=UPI0022503CB8|nr:uncharacterized protein LOC127803011 [Diospyros lotus]XP_052194952.1 uncharacterized protein LOC127803011 [Diospyros lotus]
MLASNNALLYNRFTKFEENAIQVAVVAEQEKIVSELLDREIDLELLKEENDYGETTLTLAAAKGRMRIVKMLVNKYDDLADVKNGQGQLPVIVAALYGHKDIVRYLYEWTLLENLFEGEKEDQSLNTGNKVQYQSMNNRFGLFKACIRAGIYDIALEVFKLGPGQCIEEMKEEEGTTLYPLALADLAKEKRNRFLAWVNDNISSTPLEYGKKYMDNHLPALKLLRRISKELSSLYKYDTETKVTVLGKPMLMAILQENEDFVKIATQDCPDVLWLEIDGLTLFDHAISKGLRKIYKFAFKRPETKLFATVRPDRDGNTLLHRAAKLSSSQSLGPALQMQIELQRFKEVEKMAPMCKGLVNNNNQTPQDLFVVEHKELKDQGRDWLKEIATSCSVVATLIVTIMFAAAFTAPGGYKEDTGIPTNLKSKYFTVYIISDAFSLSFSCTSAMLFLGIHTSLFREEDFLNKLPLALMSGLFTLFLSIATMLVAFGTALVIMLPENFVWIPIPLLVLGSTPVCIYAILHVRIFIQVLCWTFLNPTN